MVKSKTKEARAVTKVCIEEEVLVRRVLSNEAEWNGQEMEEEDKGKGKKKENKQEGTGGNSKLEKNDQISGKSSKKGRDGK